MTDPRPLGPVQLAILRVLWDRGSATVAEVHALVSREREIHPSTVGTMLQKMEKRGVVGHRREGRHYVYLPTVSEPEVRRTMVGALLRGLFGGDPLALLGHLVREEDLDEKDLERLRDEVERRGEEGS